MKEDLNCPVCGMDFHVTEGSSTVKCSSCEGQFSIFGTLKGHYTTHPLHHSDEAITGRTSVRKLRRISVDFDGTLRRDFGKGQNIFQKIVLWYVKRKQAQGVTIILNTLRSSPERLEPALKWLELQDFVPDLVNENGPQVEESRKISADMYIDDRNAGLLGFLLRTF